MDFLGSILDYLNPFSDNFILKLVIEGIGDLFSILSNIFSFIGRVLNPFSEDFWGYKLIELLKECFQFLFIPSEERLTAISNTVTSKFAFIDSIKEAINSLENIFNNLGNSPKLETTNINSKYYNGKLTVIDLSWYAPFKSYGDLVITGFVYLMFLWRFYTRITSIINGSSPGVVEIYKHYNS